MDAQILGALKDIKDILETIHIFLCIDTIAIILAIYISQYMNK